MNSINKKSIVFGLGLLSILVFSLLITPVRAFAVTGYVNNPTPYIISISPSSINANHGSNIVIAITGNGFIPSSIARVNGADRVTTFIDYSHLLIKLNPSDIYNTDGVYINVFNGFPGGGYSNAKLFTVNKVSPATNINNNYNQSPTITRTTTNTGNDINSNTNNNYSNTNTSQTENTSNTNKDVDSNNLASNAIFGSTGSFFPSGLVQWILFAIIILLIVILARKVFGAKKKYDEAPMKTP